MLNKLSSILLCQSKAVLRLPKKKAQTGNTRKFINIVAANENKGEIFFDDLLPL